MTNVMALFFVNPVQFMTCTAYFLTFVMSSDLFMRKVTLLIFLMMEVSNLILEVQKLALLQG